MRKNIICVGDDIISGEVGKVYAAGSVTIKDGDVLKLSGAGEVTIEDSYIEDIKLAGEMNIKDSNIGKVRMAGLMSSTGRCNIDTLVAIGQLKAEDLECKILRNSSNKFTKVYINATDKKFSFNKEFGFDFYSNSGKKSNWEIKLNLNDKNTKKDVNQENNSTNQSCIYEGSIKAELFENFCDCNLDFNYHFKNIINVHILRSKEVVECEEFYNFHILDVEGVSADKVYIVPKEESRISHIMGGEITIGNKFKANVDIPDSIEESSITRELKTQPSRMNITSIEGDDLNIDYVKVETISGDNVILGRHVEANRVEYKTSIVVSDGAIVNELVKVV